MTEKKIFLDLLEWLKYDYNEMYKKYLKMSNEDDRKNFMRRALIHKIKIDPDYLLLCPKSLMDKLNIKYIEYDFMDEKINKLCKKTKLEVKCILSSEELFK